MSWLAGRDPNIYVQAREELHVFFISELVAVDFLSITNQGRMQDFFKGVSNVGLHAKKGPSFRLNVKKPTSCMLKGGPDPHLRYAQ